MSTITNIKRCKANMSDGGWALFCQHKKTDVLTPFDPVTCHDDEEILLTRHDVLSYEYKSEKKVIANQKSVAAATAALNAHASALGIEGDASIQLWHLIASLSEWAAVNGVSVEAELKEFNETLENGELDLPAAEMARKVMLRSLDRSQPSTVADGICR